MPSITVTGIRRSNDVPNPSTYAQGLSNLRSWLTAKLTTNPLLEVEDHEVEFYPIACQSYGKPMFEDNEWEESLRIEVVLYTDKTGRNRENLKRLAKEVHETACHFAREYLPGSYTWITVTANVFGTSKFAQHSGAIR